MASRPLVLPEPFTGETSWEQWSYHFESVAAVNEWDEGGKLKWLKVRLTGRAQIAFQRLSEAAQGDYKEAVKALKERFEPAARKHRYQAEFQTRRKRKAEGWADFAEDLKALADKAFPELEEKARERLALNAYLGQLEHPQVAFSVKQRNPQQLDEAVSATLEMEAYVSPKTGSQSVSGVDTQGTIPVAAVSPQDKLASLVEKLVERVEKLEHGHAPRRNASDEQQSRVGQRPTSGAQSGGPRLPAKTPSETRGPRTFNGACWLCGKKGHLARQCQKGAQKHQGN